LFQTKMAKAKQGFWWFSTKKSLDWRLALPHQTSW